MAPPRRAHLADSLPGGGDHVPLAPTTCRTRHLGVGDRLAWPVGGEPHHDRRTVAIAEQHRDRAEVTATVTTQQHQPRPRSDDTRDTPTGRRDHLCAHRTGWEPSSHQLTITVNSQLMGSTINKQLAVFVRPRAEQPHITLTIERDLSGRITQVQFG